MIFTALFLFALDFPSQGLYFKELIISSIYQSVGTSGNDLSKIVVRSQNRRQAKQRLVMDASSISLYRKIQPIIRTPTL